MKKIFSYNTFFFIGIIFLMASCQKMDYDKQYSSTYPINGEWTVTYEAPDKSTDGPHKMLVYNTSFSKDSIWLEDGEYWPFKFKAKANMSNVTFATENSPSSITLTISGKPQTFTDVCTIQAGKIVKTDSIYMEVEFVEGDPGSIYKVYGHRRTSYEEYMGL